MKNFLLTGLPGVGKTTVIKTLSRLLKDLNPSGFYTEEIREGGVRKGFRLRSIDGRKEGILAHVEIDGPRVGRYGVDVKGFEGFLSTLSFGSSLVLIDEIGKMECLCPMFPEVIKGLLDSHRVVVATVAMKGRGFIQEVKRRPDCVLVEVDRRNRDRLPLELAERIRSLVKGP